MVRIPGLGALAGWVRYRERPAKIEEMTALDAQRVAAIERLTALDRDRVAKIEEMTALDAARVAQICELNSRLSTLDGMSVADRNLIFLDEPRFAAAWLESARANSEGWPQGVPDIRWRAHIALWAARHGLGLAGDFVECGVHTGLLSLVICHALDFGALPRNFFLFDTFAGIPLAELGGEELARATRSNEDYYRDVWDIAVRNFSPFANACLVRGALPESLPKVSLDRIAYLSMDLNNAIAEKRTIEQLWDKVVPGAIVLLDDYAWAGHEAQYEMWNGFAQSVKAPIAVLPTGQGIMIKP